MVQSAPVSVRHDSEDGTSVRARVLRFLNDRHPAGMVKRVAVDTARATRGAGISANTIAQWGKRECDPSAAHLVTLGLTYGIEFLAAVYVGVPALAAAAAQARRDALAEQLRIEDAETERLISLARAAR